MHAAQNRDGESLATADIAPSGAMYVIDVIDDFRDLPLLSRDA
jgi:hypothetical protein